MVPADYRLRTETFLKTARMSDEPSAADWQTALRFRHGDGVLPLTANLAVMEAAINGLSVEAMFADLPDVWRRSVNTLGDLHAHWRLARLSFPAALPELFTSSLELQSKARRIAVTELTDSFRGVET